GVDVLTQHNDIARTGANLAETTLTTAAVGGPRFQRLFTLPVDAEIYAQPLIASDLVMSDRGRRNVLYVATVADTVYAFDAEDATRTAPLWKRSVLGAGERPVENTDLF